MVGLESTASSPAPLTQQPVTASLGTAFGGARDTAHLMIKDEAAPPCRKHNVPSMASLLGQTGDTVLYVYRDFKFFSHMHTP